MGGTSCIHSLYCYSDIPQWLIPLHIGTSVGVVMRQDLSDAKRAAAKTAGEDTSQYAHYMRGLDCAPNLKALLSNAKLILKDDKVSVQTASDYSYHSDSYAGPHYRIVGDAGGEPEPRPIPKAGRNIFCSSLH
jgi:hypothetical protein